ncbi:response regulator [Paraburkholderia strydomiana]|uniref:response regulator n=1 Tax=Paraburkholderia strydomiana TaxID=1245417 RepID=UPI0038BB54B5
MAREKFARLKWNRLERVPVDHRFSKLSVYVIEDSEIVLRRLVALIESSGLAKVVGMSDDATDAVNEILLLTPDVVLVDIHLRVGSGLDVIGKLKAARCTALQIVLTNHSLPAVRRAATAAGPTISLTRLAKYRPRLIRSTRWPDSEAAISRSATESRGERH